MIQMHLLLIQVYTEILPTIREIGKKHGYAIAVHGSITRDFDLIAVPWIDEVSHPITLVDEILETLGKAKHNKDIHNKKEIKPNHRIAYDIQLGMGLYIDLSVVYFGDVHDKKAD